MTPRYLLDTNILSEPMRPRPKQKALNRIQQYEGRLATAAPVLHELLFGCLILPISKRRDALEAYLQDIILPVFPVLPYDTRAAQWHAAERSRQLAVGKRSPFVDGQIAAIAQTNDLILVTDNTKDFRDFKDLRIENWLR